MSEASYSRSSVFSDKLRSGCEPSLGDIGCCIDDNDQDEQLPEHFNRKLQIEDFDLILRPG